MAYSFDQIFAADPSNPANVAQNAAVTIFAPGDNTMTPLTITDPDGSPLPNPIPVNANGFGSAFAHATLDRVAWAGGGFTGFFTSYEGMKQVALDAQTAAETAATTAGTEAAVRLDELIAAGSFEGPAGPLTNLTIGTVEATPGNPLTDEIIAAEVSAGTATKAALNATIGLAVAPKLDASTAAVTYATTAQGGYGSYGLSSVGDSITAVNQSADPGPRVGTMHANMLSILSGQRILWREKFATPGEKIDFIRTTHVPQVIALNPKPAACLVLAGTNDIGVGGTLASATIGKLTALWQDLINAGIRPIAATIPPRDDSTTVNTQVMLFNALIRKEARLRGLDLADYHAALVDPATGLYKAGLKTDSVHPNNKGHVAMARKFIASGIIERFPTQRPHVCSSVIDATNIIPSGYGMFQVDTNADGIANGWGSFSTGSGQLFSIVTDAEGQKWQQIERVVGDGGNGLLQLSFNPSASTAQVGDVVEIAVRIQTENIEGNGTLNVNNTLTFTNSTGAYTSARPLYGIEANIADGMGYVRTVVPPGTTQFKIDLSVNGAPTLAGGKARFGQVTFRNLTALGIA